MREKIEGCPCCVSNEDEAPIHKKALRDLDEDDLGVYAAKAMTTWGDADDYRHFLPRLFELSLTTHHAQLGLEPWMIAGKLAYGDFSSWPAVERRAIDELISDLKSVVTDDDDEDPPEGAPLWRKSQVAEFRRELDPTLRGVVVREAYARYRRWKWRARRSSEAYPDPVAMLGCAQAIRLPVSLAAGVIAYLFGMRLGIGRINGVPTRTVGYPGRACVR